MKRKILISIFRIDLFFLLFFIVPFSIIAQEPAFKVLIVASADPDHSEMIDQSQSLFEKMGKENNFTVYFTKDTSLINEVNLANYKVFVQLQLAPFDMSQQQQIALQYFISSGKGWVGVHGAGLTGKQFIDPKTPYWQWFENLMGNIRYTTHPSQQTGTIMVEDKTHPIMKNLPDSFSLWDEWYEFDENPRSNVHVLATANEESYKPIKPQGDHPMIWTNPLFDRAVYIAIGHHISACSDPNFNILMRNSILWAASPVGF